MDSQKEPPLIFANKVIRQIADHLLGSDVILSPKDFSVLRVVYRRLGGTWEKLIGGDLKSLKILEDVIIRWGKSPNLKREPKDNV